MKQVKLGTTELYVSPVGIGTLTMGFSQKNLSIEEGSAIIRYAIDCGINFLDTAQYYDTYRYVRPALEGLSELPVISSKTLESSYEGARDAVYECLRELGLNRIDIFLLHEIRGVRDFESRSAAWQALIDLKAEGLIRAIGISTHHVDACSLMASIEECDVVFALINITGLGIRTIIDDSDIAGSREAMEATIKACSEAGKGVFTMKAFGGGNLVADYTECLDYASSVEGNSSVMLGMASLQSIQPNVFAVDTVHRYVRSAQ